MITVLSVLGTRPEAIKMAPVLRELTRRGDRFRSVVCVTGQHRELLDCPLEMFEIRPDVDLDLMEPDQPLSRLAGRMLERLDPILASVGPCWVLAQGDTTTAFAAALAAYHRRIPFGHVEAGLRTGDRFRPFPEEGYRILADALADLCFAPTERAKQVLLREGKPERAVRVTGNTVVDALLAIASREPPEDLGEHPTDGEKKEVLVTVHRRESFGGPLREICRALRDLSVRFEEERVTFILPVHPNPNIREPVREILSGRHNVILAEPLRYPELVRHLRRSVLVLTDSGGIQEEAPTFGVPVLVMRDVTERPEGIEAGVARLVGTEADHIVGEVTRLLRDSAAREAMRASANPYGDGKAAGRIVAALEKQDLP